MNFSNIISIVAVIFGLFFGVLFGFALAKYMFNKRNKEIERNAKEVLEGKRENVLEIDGVKYDATRFKVRDDKGNEKIIDLKGGGIVKDDKKESKEERENIIEKDSNSIRENSRDRGKKKRNSRISRRNRRFG